MSLNAKEIAFELSERDIPVIKVTEATQVSDGIIQITPELQVQVSILDDFLNIVKITPDGTLDFGEVTESIDQIEQELKGLLTKREVTPYTTLEL